MPGSSPRLSGKTIGKLFVESDTGRRVGSFVVYQCRCSCGSVVERISSQLGRNPKMWSCGCDGSWSPGRRLNISGVRFGRLLAIKHVDNGDWFCRCDCGAEVVTRIRNLRYGTTKSCGCLASERRAEALRRTATTHGKSNTPEYKRHISKARRARESGAAGSHTTEEWRTVYDAWNGVCAGCKVWLPFSNMQKDHIVPLCRGGTDNKENLQPLCKSCNSSKHTMTMDEWVASQRYARRLQLRAQ